MKNAVFVLLVLVCLTSISCHAEVKKMSAEELMATADSRIEQIRKADVEVKVVDPTGRPVPGARVKAEQTRHAFLFGCNIFPLFSYQGEQRLTYGREFAALLNYATLPFYWGSYEPQPGQTQSSRENNERIARWCKERGIATKGHPLVWHEVYPAWGPSDLDEAKARLKARVEELVAHFKGLIDRWDVVNEATVSARFENGFGRWVKRDGAAGAVGEALEWAHRAHPQATLLYNDFNVSPDFEKLLEDLAAAKRPFQVIGIQSHMHGGEWPLERAWEVCQTYARFGKPLHFTELTVLSGEHGWEKAKPWPSTPEGEAKQADYVAKFYTLLFSHPAVEAITWWDFMDGGWQGAPAGLVRADLTPKPAYERLLSLVKSKWWTKTEGETDESGSCRLRGFLGRYRVTVITPKGYKQQEFDLKRGENTLTMKLAGSGK
ncbi:MAG: endo-1,4-beta-xylanase [Armatimonadetes bacterium]|nr:endo-1,4-beta-xylanase [Armatimonadota bacterium]